MRRRLLLSIAPDSSLSKIGISVKPFCFLTFSFWITFSSKSNYDDLDDSADSFNEGSAFKGLLASSSLLSFSFFINILFFKTYNLNIQYHHSQLYQKLFFLILVNNCYYQ